MDCDCEFDYPEPDGEPSWHFTRTCPACGMTWGALHCIHDGVQNPCPCCGWIDPVKASFRAHAGEATRIAALLNRTDPAVDTPVEDR